jgi:phosphoheptose isomerase
MKKIDCKLGNMRKVADWVLYPMKEGTETVIIQSDRRIADVNLTTGKAVLSSGKGGSYCNTFLHLNPIMGAVEIDVPADVLEELKKLTATGVPAAVLVCGG